MGAAALAARRDAIAATALAQNEQFIPALVYRTGPYAPNGIPFADGVADYLDAAQRARRRHQRRQDHVRGMRDRLRHRQGRRMLRAPQGQGPDRRGLLLAALDRHHLRADREGAGRQDPAADHGLRPLREPRRRGVPVELHRVGTYWTAADVAIQHIAKELGGFDKLKGKKISLVYHDSPTARSRSRRSKRAPRSTASTFKAIPVTHPGVEQKSQWLQIRQDRPDYVLLWGWGVMNSTAIKEAAAVGYPRDKMIGVWWSGAEPDVTAGRRSVQGLQGADAPASAPASSRCTRTSRSSCSPRASRSPRTTTSARCSTTAA